MNDRNKTPGQGLLDYLSRTDELLIENTKAIRSLEAVTNIILPRAQRLSLPELRQRLESGEEVPYQVKELSLTAARTDVEVQVEGDRLTVQTNGTLDGVSIRFNMQGADPVPVKYFNPWRQQFFKIFLTHTAQPGKTLYLAIGKAASSEAMSFEMATEMVNKVSAVLDSSTANLGIGVTYTGEAFSIEEWGRIIGSCYSDVAGTLYVDQREDGTNWDIRSTIDYPAGGLIGFTVEVVANEARLVFTNGAVGQAAFRLYARLRRV